MQVQLSEDELRKQMEKDYKDREKTITRVYKLLSGSEESKIECVRRHFKAISDNGYIYDVAKDYKSLYDIVTK